jgi:uncharacterized membrane protein
VVTHIGLANPPVRDTLVARLGENGFRIGYSLLSLALLIGAIQAYQRVPTPAEPLWVAPTGVWHVATLVMLGASILFVGSFTPANKALAGVPVDERPATGVLRVTRHPMMWSFGLWAAVHATLSGMLPTVILALGIGVVALVGAAAQDGKKRVQLGDRWAGYVRQTSYWPLGAQVSGKQPWSSLWPGLVPVVGGIAVWLLLTWLHPSLMKAPVVPPWGFGQ